MQRNLEKVLGDQSLISQFETANNTVLEIKNSIENRKLSEEDIRQVVSMMTKVEDLYKTIIKHADAAAKRETRGAAG